MINHKKQMDLLIRNEQLWDKLQKFSIDNPDAQFSFSKRLAKENAWSLNYAKRVIEEYKKFIYLSAVTKRPLTPSEEVDQAWHLHMLYTKSYLDEMCDCILGFRFNHEPTLGGKKEGEKFDTQYLNTLLIYRSYFGCEPPSDIWLPSKKRFANITYQRVNVTDNYVLNKKKVKEYLASYAFAPLIIFCSFFIFASTIDWGMVGLCVLLVAVGVFIVRGIYRYINRDERRSNKSYGGSSSNYTSGCTVGGAFFGCGGSDSDSGHSGCSSSDGGSSSGCGSSCGGGCGGD